MNKGELEFYDPLLNKETFFQFQKKSYIICKKNALMFDVSTICLNCWFYQILQGLMGWDQTSKAPNQEFWCLSIFWMLLRSWIWGMVHYILEASNLDFHLNIAENEFQEYLYIPEYQNYPQLFPNDQLQPLKSTSDSFWKSKFSLRNQMFIF